MKTSNLLFWLLTLLLAVPSAQSQQIPPADWQIETALMAVPADYRESARVLGYSPQGALVTLREGEGPYIALADDPKTESFSTAAYHKELDAFMARGRQLKAEGKSFQEIFDLREKEVRAGSLHMPERATLCVFTGTVDPNTGAVSNAYTRYVFYIPFATGESTGLPTTPAPPGHAWIMDPGTHRAHIMISPPKG